MHSSWFVLCGTSEMCCVCSGPVVRKCAHYPFSYIDHFLGCSNLHMDNIPSFSCDAMFHGCWSDQISGTSQQYTNARFTAAIAVRQCGLHLDTALSCPLFIVWVLCSSAEMMTHPYSRLEGRSAASGGMNTGACATVI